MPGNQSYSENQTSMVRADFGSTSRAGILAVSGSSLGCGSAEQKMLTLKKIPSPTAPTPTLNKVRLVADSAHQKFCHAWKPEPISKPNVNKGDPTKNSMPGNQPNAPTAPTPQLNKIRSVGDSDLKWVVPTRISSMPGNQSHSENQTSMVRADFGSTSRAGILAVSGSSLGRGSAEQKKLNLKKIPHQLLQPQRSIKFVLLLIPT